VSCFVQGVDISRARKFESDYDDSIGAYKETPLYKFFLKMKRRHQVRKKKEALRRANQSLRSHYYVRLPSLSELDGRDNEIGYQPGIHF
jgi:hypothetical protein